ncbi:transmembrane protease serine 12 [Pholidichthys leucotaenia]
MFSLTVGELVCRPGEIPEAPASGTVSSAPVAEEVQGEEVSSELGEVQVELSLPLGGGGCGQRPLFGPLGKIRIVGGQNAPEGAWPWQVSIQLHSLHFCGGTILNSLYVVTASHCFHDLLRTDRSYFRVVAGLRVFSSPGSHIQVRSIRKVKMHEDYSSITFDNDVSLVLLSSPFNFNDYVQPICIPHSVAHEVMLNFSHCFISGWGSNYFNGHLMGTLQEAEVKLIDRGTCNLDTWYNHRITENMICAGEESGVVDSCQGDSGSPLQCYSPTEERFYVVGVTSFGVKCGIPYRPGVYTRASRFAGWLNKSQTEDRKIESSAHRPDRGLTTVLLFAALKYLTCL